VEGDGKCWTFYALADISPFQLSTYDLTTYNPSPDPSGLKKLILRSQLPKRKFCKSFSDFWNTTNTSIFYTNWGELIFTLQISTWLEKLEYSIAFAIKFSKLFPQRNLNKSCFNRYFLNAALISVRIFSYEFYNLPFPLIILLVYWYWYIFTCPSIRGTEVNPVPKLIPTHYFFMEISSKISLEELTGALAI